MTFEISLTSGLFCISAWDDVVEAEGGGRDEQAQAQGDEERHPTQGGPQQGKGDSSHDSSLILHSSHDSIHVLD